MSIFKVEVKFMFAYLDLVKLVILKRKKYEALFKKMAAAPLVSGDQFSIQIGKKGSEI